MKKALLIGLTLGVVAALAVPAMAIDWSATGAFHVKNAYYKNIDYRSPAFLGGVPGSIRFIGMNLSTGAPAFSSRGILDAAWNEDSWWMQMRGVIVIRARASEDLYGALAIEVNSTRFGDADPSASAVVAFPPNGGYAGRWNADATAIQVKAMLIDFKVPEIPLWFKVGIQPYMIRPVVFMYADASGISARTRFNIGDATLQMEAFWAKILHRTATVNGTSVPTDWTTADDANFFGANLNVAISTFTPGVFFAMERQSEIYQMPTALVPVYRFGQGNRNLWWIGPYLDAKIGPVDITLDYIYSGGEDEQDVGNYQYIVDLSGMPINWVVRGDREHSGMLGRGVVALNIGKFKVGVGGFYGSGDDLDTRHLFEGICLPHRSETAKFNEDFLVLMGDFGLRAMYGNNNVGGLYRVWSAVGQGVWYVRGFADFAVTDWLKLKVNGGYIGDTASGSITTGATGPYYGASTSVPAGTVIGGDQFGTDADDDDFVGWEIDAAVQINIYKNLYLDTAFGYLIAGKALAGQYGGYRAQDPWAWMTVLSYMF